MGYTTVFGGNLISPTQVSEITLNLTADITLVWPTETAPNANLAAQIVDVNSSGSFTITTPPANTVSNGQALIFNNLSAFVITIASSGGVALATLAPGAVWFLYVRNNSTPAGIWGSFQYGAQVSAPTAAALAGPGLDVVGVALGQTLPVTNLSQSYTVLNTDQAALLNWTGATGAIGLPSASAVGNGFYVQVRNSGTSPVQVTASGSDAINGQPQVAFQVSDSAFVVTDGVTWYTIGLGTVQSSFFNLLVISLAGLSGTYVLQPAAYNQIGYRFTGALAGDVVVQVPPTTQEYWVDNQTTGFAFSIGVLDQPTPPSLISGQTGIFYADGSQVVNAIGNTLSNPVAIAQGGTNAITVAAAQQNLAVTSAADTFLIAISFG